MDIAPQLDGVPGHRERHRDFVQRTLATAEHVGGLGGR
jgi:hypothetical protein